jgi:hypothetical protein
MTHGAALCRWAFTTLAMAIAIMQLVLGALISSDSDDRRCWLAVPSSHGSGLRRLGTHRAAMGTHRHVRRHYQQLHPPKSRAHHPPAADAGRCG